MTFKTSEKQRLQLRASLKRRRERLKASGLCVDCGMEDVKPGKTLCLKCLIDRQLREETRKNRLKEARREEAIEAK